MGRIAGRCVVLGLAVTGLGLVGLVGLLAPPAAADRHQQITVIDGDTLEIDGRLVQLYGIDAPELGQICQHDGKAGHCGLSAAYELHKMIELGGESVRCEAVAKTDQPDVHVCHKGTKDLARSLLAAGYAVALVDADPAYRDAQAVAREGGLGLWHSDFLDPDRWRHGERLSHLPTMPVDDCPVKGTVAADGQRVYYVPTDADYDSFAIDPTRGERLFCSDEAAREAGWQRPPLSR